MRPLCDNGRVKLPGRCIEHRPGRTARSKLTMLEQSSLWPAHAAEEWRPIPGLEGRYDVSDHGRVRALRFRNATVDKVRAEPLILRPGVNALGYHGYVLAGRNRKGHQLVLEAFVGPRSPGLVTGHLNGNPGDNRLANLAWITPSENQQHRFLHGTVATGAASWPATHLERLSRGEKHAATFRAAHGEQHGIARFTEVQVIEMRAARAGGESVVSLATRYGAPYSTVDKIVRRVSWRHLP